MTSYQIKHYTELDSTNSHAFALAQQDINIVNQVIWADSQYTGKGRANRSWISPKGNLYFSLIIRPKIKISELTKLSIISAVAIAQSIDLPALEFKWPNDLLLTKKKFAGILIQSQNTGDNCDFVIIGIGVNINSYPSEVMFAATSLAEFGFETSPEKLLERILNRFNNLLQNYFDYGFENIHKYWLKKAYKLNQELTIKPDGKSFTGIFKGLNHEGNMVLLKDGKEFIFSVADIS